MINNRTIRIIYAAIIIGLIAGIVFIIVQPLFGMTSLTSRHIDYYMKVGNYSSIVSILIAWGVHLAISIVYALAVAIVFIRNCNFYIITFWVLILTWLTTVIAPIAHPLLLNLMSKGILIGPSQWPEFNFNFDVKFLLHLVFFAFIAVLLNRFKQLK